MTKRSDAPIWRLYVVTMTLLGVLNLIPSSDGETGKHPRDLTGKYHGEHSHSHVHVHSSDESTSTSVNSPLPLPPPVVTEVAPHCLCVVRGTGCLGREAYTRQFDGISKLVCGLSFERCCFEDPWPGVVDQWADKAPCVPQEVCPRYYGQAATDIQDYGVMGPCPGFGAVRCLTGAINTEDVSLLVSVPPPPPPPVVVEPTPTIVVPIIPEPPREEVPPPSPPTYDLPPPPSPVYEIPEYEPPTPVQPPAQTYEAPVERNPIPVTPVAEPSPPYSRPGPPYLWRNLAPTYGYQYPFYGYGWPYGKFFTFRKRFGFGYGFY